MTRPRKPLAFRFHPEAESEFLIATAWYADHSPEVASRFVDAVEEAIESIRLFPEAGVLVVADVRGRLARPFPYRIMYRTRDDAVQILAVAHTSRHPDFWKNRLHDQNAET